MQRIRVLLLHLESPRIPVVTGELFQMLSTRRDLLILYDRNFFYNLRIVSDSVNIRRDVSFLYD